MDWVLQEYKFVGIGVWIGKETDLKHLNILAFIPTYYGEYNKIVFSF